MPAGPSDRQPRPQRRPRARTDGQVYFFSRLMAPAPVSLADEMERAAVSRAVMPRPVTPDEASQGAKRRREGMSMRACMQAAAMRAAQPGVTYDVRGVSEGLRVGRGPQRHGGWSRTDIRQRQYE